MGVLTSDEFKGDSKLEACATIPSGHLQVGSPPGPHILKVQLALEQLRPTGPAIDAGEKAAKRYGPTTAAAVLNYKKTHVPPIINTTYQRDVDPICGQMTIKAMDEELHGGGGSSHAAVIDRAFADSRASLRVVRGILTRLAADIAAVEAAEGADKTLLMAKFLSTHARDVLVISRRLFVSADAFSEQFKGALARVRDLLNKNLALPKGIREDGIANRCLATNFRPVGVPFAATQARDAQPKVSVCTPFFAASRELQRDVITHEYFHVIGLADVEGVTNTDKAFRNANTLAQVVAFLNDRFRQANSDGNEASVPPLPVP